MSPTGFVDLQVNGFKGVDFSSPALEERACREACRAVLQRGTVAFLPTLVTSEEDVYRRNLPLIARVMKEDVFAGRLPGFHIEGPFISPRPGAVGAHKASWVRAPDLPLLERMQEWAGGRVRLLTIAGELEGADELIRGAVKLGIVVSLGHQTAAPEEVSRSAEAGATALTHLGNGMPGQVDRHRNALWAGLAEDRLGAMIITDGHHLPREVIKVIWRVKGAARTIVVSDAASVAGLAPGRYSWQGNEIELEPSGRLHDVKKGCLAGSSAMMLDCMNYLAGLKLATRDELWSVGFYNPLRLLGLSSKDVNLQSLGPDLSSWPDRTSGFPA